MLSSSVLVKNISPTDCWEILKNNKNSFLIDVRTLPELMFTGSPDLSYIKKLVINIEIQKYPNMIYNQDFVRELEEEINNKDATLLFLCRSGARSAVAASEAIQAGYKNSFNVEDGFEGAVDHQGHRSKINGWKFNNLPWSQN